ncbi:MAG: S41 family peptidase [Candidatus Melainabacteria bacterium]|nr:S41 family peptidase [Candidatus Melainabacteria bacterium]
MVDKSLPSDRSGAVQNAKDDSASHALTETQSGDSRGAMWTGTKTAFLDTSVWGDVAFLTADAASPPAPPKPADQNRKQTPASAKDGSKTTPEPETCAGNDDYKSIMDLAARNIYEPSKLGDLKKIMEPPCLKTTADAVALADKALEVAGDPYTDVLPANEAAARRTSQEGHLIGVGVQINRAESAPGKAPKSAGPIDVQIVFPNSPADVAGIKKGDQITSVGGKDVSKMSPDEVAAKLLRGAEGTDAKVSVLRDGKAMEFNMKRADYNFPSVEEKKIGDFAYIHLSDLGQDDSADELKGALDRHQDAKGFVLDLRDNPGGLVPQALLAASLIMEKGEIMAVRSRVDSDPAKPEYATEKYSVTPTGITVSDENDELIGDGEETRMPDLVKKPLIVLTNQGTASAAEILAGALKDNKEGVIVGEKTFGKGIGQQIFDEMPGGSMLSVTNFRFFSPSGQWIGDGHNNRTGITPDFAVVNPKGVEYGSVQDAQLNAALKLLEEKTKGDKK